MTDLEITRLCAEAMGFFINKEQYSNITLLCREDSEDGGFQTMWYWPLTNDAQAMALVKKFGLQIFLHGDFWCCIDFGQEHQTEDVSLNMAICECVAKMMKGKAS